LINQAHQAPRAALGPFTFRAARVSEKNLNENAAARQYRVGGNEFFNDPLCAAFFFVTLGGGNVV
jgi:hypothetical protein